jgi:hypothetical protein
MVGLTFCVFFVAYVGYVSTAEEEVSTDLRLPEDVEVLRSELLHRSQLKWLRKISRIIICPVFADGQSNKTMIVYTKDSFSSRGFFQ